MMSVFHTQYPNIFFIYLSIYLSIDLSICRSYPPYSTDLHTQR